MKHISRSFAILAITTMFVGCASIVCPHEYPLSISSNVKNAKVTIYNRGELVQVVSSPARVRLSPKGGYFLPANYQFIFEKEGWCGDELTIDADFNWWYVGNIVFGGLLGILIVDPATGAMWKINDTYIYGSLKPLPGNMLQGLTPNDTRNINQKK